MSRWLNDWSYSPLNSWFVRTFRSHQNCAMALICDNTFHLFINSFGNVFFQYDFGCFHQALCGRTNWKTWLLWVFIMSSSASPVWRWLLVTKLFNDSSNCPRRSCSAASSYKWTPCLLQKVKEVLFSWN